MGTTFDGREVAILLSAVLLVTCSLRFRHELRRVPRWPLLASAIAGLVIGNVATVLEHFVAYNFLNHVEHAAYALQSVVIATWALRLERA